MSRMRRGQSVSVRPRGIRAFTVPELLAVVAIILIILALLLPNLGSARWEAIKTKCGAQMRQISISARAYSLDHESYFIPVRSESVQIAIDPNEQILFANYGYPKEHWRCPGRDYEPQIEPGFGNQLVIGYQYFGGITNWINHAGTKPSKSPIKRGIAGPNWVFAADTSIKVDGVWGGGRPQAFGDMPSHKRNQPYPEGTWHTYVDGSAKWVKFKETYMLHSWSVNGRMCFFLQEDLPDGLTLAQLVPATAHMP